MRITGGAFLGLHAIAHAPGILASRQVTTVEDASFQPDVLVTDASVTAVAVPGAAWLVSTIAYLLAAVGLITNRRWWPAATLVAGVISLAMTLLWMKDAIVGLVINVALIGVLAALAVWTSPEVRASPPSPTHR